MSLYPSLEDMKVDHMVQAQLNQMGPSPPQQGSAPLYPYPDFNQGAMPVPGSAAGHIYPALGEFMGLELSEAIIAENMPEYSQVALLQQVKINKKLHSTNFTARSRTITNRFTQLVLYV